MQGLANLQLNALTDSVFPVPAGPYGFDDLNVLNAEIRVE